MTNVLLNQTQRDREAAVARTMTDMIVTNCKSTTDIVPQTVLAHHFGLAKLPAGYAVTVETTE